MIMVMPFWFGLGFFFVSLSLFNLQQLEQIQKELSVLEEDIKRVEVRNQEFLASLAIFQFHEIVTFPLSYHVKFMGLVLVMKKVTAVTFILIENEFL